MATKRRTRAQWQELVDKQAESELSVSEFCTHHDLTVSNFYLWRKKLSDDSQSLAPQDNWLAFDMPASAKQNAGSTWEIELALPGGVVLRMNRAA
jgi:transposase-like protein|tara:strand:+ start:324 stop:608 length:285 start_codon:yes stop_codon:yes gene_type:complete